MRSVDATRLVGMVGLARLDAMSHMMAIKRTKVNQNSPIQYLAHSPSAGLLSGTSDVTVGS
jgi:hypothetical protein